MVIPRGGCEQSLAFIWMIVEMKEKLLSERTPPFLFDGVYVTDPLHYQMLKELYSESLQGKEPDREFLAWRSVCASLIVRLDAQQEAVHHETLASLAEWVTLDEFLPAPVEKMSPRQRQDCLVLFNRQFDRVLRDWAEPPVTDRTIKAVREIFAIHLKV